MTEWLSALLEKNSPDLIQKGIWIQRPAQFIQINGGAGKDRKVNILVFSAGESHPALVAKISRTHAYETQIKQEYENLQFVWQYHDRVTGLSQPVGLYEHAGQLILLEKAVPGKPLNAFLRRGERTDPRTVFQDLEAARRWLESLHRVTESAPVEWDPVYEINQAVKRLPPHCLAAVPVKFLDGLRAEAAAMGIDTLPHVSGHGDFGPGNLLLDGNQVGVIDWEDFEAETWLFYDWFNFLVLYARVFPWKGWQKTSQSEKFHLAFCGKHWLSSLFRQQADEMMRAAGLTHDLLHLFFSLFLLARATPLPEHGLKRMKQAELWQKRLVWYAVREEQSIFSAKGSL